jgi:hypothetical protein
MAYWLTGSGLLVAICCGFLPKVVLLLRAQKSCYFLDTYTVNRNGFGTVLPDFPGIAACSLVFGTSSAAIFLVFFLLLQLFCLGSRRKREGVWVGY